jgi:hypothetical protein
VGRWFTAFRANDLAGVREDTDDSDDSEGAG